MKPLVRPAVATATLLGAVLGATAQTLAPAAAARGWRTDVRALCPDVDADLQVTLRQTVRDVAAAALIDVRFELQGSHIGAVQVGAGPGRYQRMLRRAVRGLQCDTGDGRPYTVAMRVQFIDPFASAGAGPLAAVSVVPAAAPGR